MTTITRANGASTPTPEGVTINHLTPRAARLPSQLLAALAAICVGLTTLATVTGPDANQEAQDNAANVNDALVTASMEAAQ